MAQQLGSWRIRRIFLFIVCFFCMWTIGYVLVNKLTTGPADSAVTMSFITLMSALGSYVFGAVWDDNNKSKSSKLPKYPEDK